MLKISAKEQEINSFQYPQLYSYLADIKEGDIEQLVRGEELGDLAFGNAVRDLSESQELILKLSPELVESKFFAQKSELERIARSWYQLIKQISEFSQQIDKPGAKHTQYSNDAKKILSDAISNFSPLVQYEDARSSNSELRSRIEKYEHDADLNQRRLEETVKEALEFRDAAEKAATAAQTAAGQTGVSAQSLHFSEIASQDETSAKLWLTWTILSSIALATTVFLFDPIYNYFSQNLASVPRLAPWIPYVSSKALVLGAIAVIVALSRKNYLAYRHNYIINKHRETALSTYEALVEASDGEGRQIILQAAANCIFAHQDTSIGRAENIQPLYDIAQVASASQKQ